MVATTCKAELEENLLIYAEIKLSSKYKSEGEFSTGSALPLYNLLPPIPLPLLLTSSSIKLLL